MTSQAPSHLIGKVLAPALKLWLRSQLDRVENLDLAISGRNREILRGYIPSVTLAATRAIYQGLHFSQLEFSGGNIRINLGEVMKRKPLRLLEPIAVSGTTLLEQADLQASLPSPLLQSGLKDLLASLVTVDAASREWEINWQEAKITSDRVFFQGAIANLQHQPIALSACLVLAGENTLQLKEIAIDTAALSPEAIPQTFNLDLGTDVKIVALDLLPERVQLQVELLVRSEEVANR